MRKIKISTVSSRVESKDERKETRDRIDEERKHQMEVFNLFNFSTFALKIIARLGLHRSNYEGQETYDT